MNWTNYDEKLIRRGEILLDLSFLASYNQDLSSMNINKIGRPFALTDGYIEFLTVVRYLFNMPYRQLEGFTRSLNRLVTSLPCVDYSSIRKRSLNLDLDLASVLRGSDAPIEIAVDSSGIKVHRSGGWIERKHGKKKRYIKIHFAVNVETKEVVAMDVTTDGVHDSKLFCNMLNMATENGDVSKVYGDGAYDSSEIYELLKSNGIDVAIKPRENSRTDTPSDARRYEVKLYKNKGYKKWVKSKKYGKRWSVETAYSTFKRIFGESCRAMTISNIIKEIIAKVYIYNMIINL
jgi:hypothetical protein